MDKWHLQEETRLIGTKNVCRKSHICHIRAWRKVEINHRYDGAKILRTEI